MNIIIFMTIAVLGAFSPAALAAVESLPASLTSSVALIEKAHQTGINEYFKNLNEVCDNLQTLNVKYQEARLAPGSALLFRIESRVLASCDKQEVYYCQSIFSRDPTKRTVSFQSTGCENDSLLIDE